MGIFEEGRDVLLHYLSKFGKLDFDELPRYLDKIGRIFDIEQIVNQELTSSDVVEYYEDSAFGYNLFVLRDSIHMALNFDGKFDADGYYGQVRIVQEYVGELHPRQVLELASGKGFNSRFLVDHNRGDIQFMGIDLTPLHVKAAREKATSVPNLHFELGDYHRLGFQDGQFDFVFVIESLCYATNMRQALSEIRRVLKPGGRFVVIDGFRKAPLENFDADIQTASILVEKTMAVPKGMVIDDWTSLAQSTGFEILTVRDVSEAIMPNLMRFHALAKAFFKFSRVSKALVKFIGSPYLVGNAIAGLLMPYTVGSGAHGYYVFALACN